MQTLPQSADNKFPDERKQAKITKRETLYIQNLIEGMVCTVAARKAGYRESVAMSSAHKWIRPLREDSEKPHLWDRWRRELDKRLNIHDINAKKLINELALIAFGSIDQLIDFPSRADAVQGQVQDARTRHFMGIATEEDMQLLAQYPEAPGDKWKTYRPGSVIKLKCIEDIPPEMMRMIAEINETKEGIRIKLHNKLDALDKLAKIMKLYADDKKDDDDPIDITINLVVKGTKSPLMLKIDEAQVIK